MDSTSLAGPLTEAASLMLTGMGFVFAFLALLIGGVKGIAWFCTRFPGPEAPTAPLRKSASVVNDGVDQPTLAAITAAIHQHRTNK
ncbi:OadG family protein [Aestuariibacter sp. A3R04]|uniref:OadG family protein n=1 Tax=Aestuariibacter sp. A3R04 TaxID=2841571 RepID=UPI001C080076|nr:OadG family transporter subunit [Aestuariibacter sp. A3R04]MBU3022248.1 OadG family protein [Aestuariibacter sp. A3R04]